MSEICNKNKINILYEDRDVVVCVKPVGVDSEALAGILAEQLGAEQGAVRAVSSQTSQGTCAKAQGAALKQVYAVHRLDKPVGGVMVYAKNKVAATALGKAAGLPEGTAGADGSLKGLKKRYIAVVSGDLECPKGGEQYSAVRNAAEQSESNACVSTHCEGRAGDACASHDAVGGACGELCDLLYHDARANKTFVVKKVRKGVKEARLRYRVVERREYRGEAVCLVEIELITGRSHQIRVQFGSRKLPLWGDGKYGSRINGGVALFSCGLSFVHPRSGERMSFEAMPQGGLPWELFEMNVFSSVRELVAD